MSERPIFVVGFQRSGTTLLQSLLGAHPRIAAPPEVHFFFRIYELRDYWGDLHDDDRATTVVRELLRAPLGLLDDCGFDEDVLTARFLASGRSYAALLTIVLDDFAERSGKSRWSEKTPAQRPALIWSVLPDAQVVHIVRDPRETVASAASTFDQGAPPWAIADQLRQFTLAAMDDRHGAPPEQYLFIRYEELAATPDRVLPSVCAFLGEEFDPQMLQPTAARQTALPGWQPPWQAEAAEPVRPPRSDWTRRLSLAQRTLVSAAVRDIAAPLGYPPVRHRTLLAARALAPLRVPHRREQRRRRRHPARTPAERYAAVQELIRAREQTMRERT